MKSMESVKIPEPFPTNIKINEVDHFIEDLSKINDDQKHDLGGGVAVRFLHEEKSLIIYSDMTSTVEVFF